MTAHAAAHQVHLDPLRHRLQLERHEAERQLLRADTVCANGIDGSSASAMVCRSLLPMAFSCGNDLTDY